MLQQLPFLGSKLLLQAQCVFLQVGLGHLPWVARRQGAGPQELGLTPAVSFCLAS